MLRLGRRPSPALVISLIALFISLGGTAFAATVINGRQIKRHSIAVNKLTPKAIRQLRGHRGPAGPAGPAGATGAAGPTGPAGSAVAFAHVSASGTLDTARSKNVSSSLLVNTGNYCLTLTVPATNVTGSVDAGNDGGYFGYVSVVIAGQDPSNFIGLYCPAGSNVLVGVENYAGVNSDYSFWLTFN